MTEEQKDRILIVDDNTININIFVELLKPEHKIFFAKSGTKALEIVRSQTPDLILLDIVMPDMDGYEVCKRLKADTNTQEIPILFISTLSDVSDKVKGFEAGGVDYITKPFHRQEALARIRTHLSLKKAMDEIKTLRGILPICSHCKNIRDDSGYWSRIEAYITKHSEAEFSHGICPVCIKEHYSEYED